MSKVSEAFKKHKALIAYVTAGDPSLAATEKLVYALEKAGADIVELGVPFSDPLADGPVIQASHQRALNASLPDVFNLAAKIRKKSDIPLVLMLSDNLVVHYGAHKFFDDAQKAGIDGTIIPDLPPEQAQKLMTNDQCQMSNKEEIDQIYLVAPTSSDKRIKLIARKSQGFVYLVSIAGVTGKRNKFPKEIGAVVKKIKSYAKKPVAIGFGISTPAQAAVAAKISDGVIVGSAIVDLISKNLKNPVPSVSKFVSSLRRVIDRC